MERIWKMKWQLGLCRVLVGWIPRMLHDPKSFVPCEFWYCSTLRSRRVPCVKSKARQHEGSDGSGLRFRIYKLFTDKNPA